MYAQTSLSSKPGFLLSAMNSHAFRWFSAACPVLLFLGFLLLQLKQICRFGSFFLLCMEEKVGGLYLSICKNYLSLTCLNGFFVTFNFDNI
jgi:hypothetical protein